MAVPTSDDLLPCPFCGGKAHIRRKIRYRGNEVLRKATVYDFDPRVGEVEDEVDLLDWQFGFQVWCGRCKVKISDEIRDFVKRSYEDEYMDPKELLAIADRVDRELVELPKDADGEYIHIGDVMEWCDSGETLTVEGIGSDVLFYIDGENAEWTAARNKRHHHEPTVEDVLREFTDEVWNRCCEGATASDSGIDELVAECAAKLRLAGENA